MKTEPERSASVTARSRATWTVVPSLPSGILMVPENALGSSGWPATTDTVSGGLVTTWVVAPTLRVIFEVFTVVTENEGIRGLAPGSIVIGTTSPAFAPSGSVTVKFWLPEPSGCGAGASQFSKTAVVLVAACAGAARPTTAPVRASDRAPAPASAFRTCLLVLTGSRLLRHDEPSPHPLCGGGRAGAVADIDASR